MRQLFINLRLASLAGWVLISLTAIDVSAAAPRIEIATSAYTHPHQLVAIDGARRLNLFCSGGGKPAVLFDSGIGGDSLDWRYVQGAVARFTRACSYDRAGYGFSDAPTRPSDATDAVDDLHRLAKAAPIVTPFVLVGHSIGGLYATVYAATYPRDVAGMLLIEPAFAGQAQALANVLSPAHKAEERAGYARIFAAERHCLDLARKMELTKPENQSSDCLDTPPDPDPDLHRELNRQTARIGTQAAFLSEWQSAFSLTDDAARDSAEAQAAHGDFGAMPLVVLTARNKMLSPGWTRAEVDRIDAATKAGRDELAARSTHGSSVFVDNSGHFIQKDQPDIVVHYIWQIVEAARQSPKPP
ncbi:MAG TPA: alpha/beta hydrolase [Acetobacteraceae bacterium]|nr:alpha/beta hydrolase [Acetobacteraceae bacterium]